MDKERWAKIAFEMQGYIDAMERIAKREKLDTVVISLSGMQEKEHGILTSVLYSDGGVHYESLVRNDRSIEISKGFDKYISYIRT